MSDDIDRKTLVGNDKDVIIDEIDLWKNLEIFLITFVKPSILPVFESIFLGSAVSFCTLKICGFGLIGYLHLPVAMNVLVSLYCMCQTCICFGGHVSVWLGRTD